MICKRCGSTNVDCQIITKTKIKTKNKSCLYWVLIGWWLELMLLLLFGLWFLLYKFIKIFIPKKYKVKQKRINTWYCKNCGYTWKD